jgi:hypothetical protein
MSVAATPSWSLRREKAESSRLAWSFSVSVAFHLFLLGLWLLASTADRLHWWDKLPPWLRANKLLTQVVNRPQPPAPQPPQEPPLMFVEVSPAQESSEAPENAKFYSDKNSKAANPDADKESDMPKITGEQKEVVRTEDVPRKEFTPLQPVAPAQAAQEQMEAKPKPTLTPGDLGVGTPDPNPKKEEGEAPRSRPRTVQEAKARLAENRLAGQKMKQEGGVRRHLEITSLDAKATPFGAYDYAFIQAVQQRWFALLDQRDYASDSRGKVVLHFTLHFDGRITETSIVENTAGEVLGLICQKAVEDPAPYAQFPKEMRHQAGDTRNIQFTFFYN